MARDIGLRSYHGLPSEQAAKGVVWQNPYLKAALGRPASSLISALTFKYLVDCVSSWFKASFNMTLQPKVDRIFDVRGCQ